MKVTNKIHNGRTIYIAGPITGHDLKERFEAFERIEAFLLDNGYNVVNPMKLKHDHDKSWESYMRECIQEMMKCNSIYLMKNWVLSDGARMEFSIATKLNFNIFEEKYF